MKVPFSKIQASGNDFILVNYDDLPLKEISAEIIRKICDRHLGIGADGVIALENIQGTYRFHYYNADGSRGEMCGNGCRAAYRFAESKNWLSENRFVFMADDGQHLASSKKNMINVEIKSRGTFEKVELSQYDLPEHIQAGFWGNTGVPHLVLISRKNFQTEEVMHWGRYFRFHKDFNPPGTNVNFVTLLDSPKIKVRTFERGVDNETLSCGTGVTASAIVADNYFNTIDSGIFVETLGGEIVVQRLKDLYLLSGPAEFVFNGEIYL